MAGQDTSVYDEVLKTVYGEGIKNLIPTKVKTLEMFEEGDSRAWGGRYIEYPAQVARSQGSGWASERGALPQAGAAKFADWRIPCKFQYLRIQLSAQVMAQSQGARFAFESAMKQEMDSVIKTGQSDRGRAILHDGRGVLALVNGDPSTGVTITVDAPGGVAGATNGARFVNVGMVIGFIDPATGVLRSANQTVTAVAAAGTSFTVGSAAASAIADNDYIVRVNGTGATDVSDTSYQKEISGLLAQCDDATYVATFHNLNRTTYPLAASTVINVNGALSADVIQRGIDLADQRGDGETSDLIMHHSVRRAYIALSDDGRRYMGSDLSNPDAGTKAAKGQRLSFGGIPITAEKYAPYGMVFGLDRSGKSRYALKSGEWADDDGAVLCRVGTGSSATDQFEAFYRIWDEFHNDYPARDFRLDNVTSTVVVSHID